jgi:hypothetical protein
MLPSDQILKLKREYLWKDNQQKANFYKNKRNQLRDWLDKLPDMLLILNYLPQKVRKNIKLEDKLPDLIQFTDAFLDITNPLPVAECEYLNERMMAIFQNVLVDVTGSALKNLNDAVEMPIDGRKCLMWTKCWAATKPEIQRCDVLKKHAMNLQRHIDPSIFVYYPNVPDDRRERVEDFMECYYPPDDRHRLIEPFMTGWIFVTPARNMPIKPPCPPRIIIDERKRLGDDGLENESEAI